MNFQLFRSATFIVVLVLGISSVKAQNCVSPSNFNVVDVFDTYVKLKWTAGAANPNPAESWRIIYGLKGFDVSAGAGDTATSTQPKITVTGLQKKTEYEAYIEQYCGLTGGYSARIGPLGFETYWTKDVGIVGVVSPVSDCQLGNADTVRVLLKNFGSAPLTLIPLRYTLNGEEVMISKPSDGMFADVLGKDSVVVFTFETVSDFSDPGEYKIVAFTKIGGDEDRSNDTFTYYLSNRLLSPYHQNFETWNGGYQPSGNSSFEYGKPNKPGIPAPPSGQFAWVTGLSNAYPNNETSYLESPCFDFSNLLVDPAIEFSIFYNTEPAQDGAWLEVSTNNGQSWLKVGGLNEGLNWYSEDLASGASWSGSNGRWTPARHFLTGVAGKSEVQIRFVFQSNESNQSDGIGIDDIRIFPAFNKDLHGAVVAVSSENDVCGLQEEPVTFTFVNVGAQTQSNFQVAYSINGGAPVVETTSFSIAPDQIRSYSFNATFDSRDKLSVVKCWTKLTGDFAPANDTAVFIIDHRPKPTPFQENFESQTLPAGWLSAGTVSNGHGNSSYVLAENLNAANPDFVHDTPRYGPIGENDSLVFSYRIVNANGGGATLLAAGTRFEVQMSDNCGQSFQTLLTISNSNHSPSTFMQQKKLGLAAFAGKALIFRFLGTWSFGDFWFDLDNINLLACATDMNIALSITNTAPGQNTGTVSAQPGLGNPPYTYLWSNGETGPDISNLAVGSYTVTITDDYGCTGTATAHVGSSATQEITGLLALQLQPNPSSGQFHLSVQLATSASNISVQVLNTFGQTVWESQTQQANTWRETIDLSQLPAGFYLARLRVDGQSAVRKLMKISNDEN
jgi:hypothetical protein